MGIGTVILIHGCITACSSGNDSSRIKQLLFGSVFLTMWTSEFWNMPQLVGAYCLPQKLFLVHIFIHLKIWQLPVLI
jgi:hypothetical protein